MSSYSKAPTLPIPPEMKITSLRPMASPPSTTLHKIPPYLPSTTSLFCSGSKSVLGDVLNTAPFLPPQWVGYLPARRRYVIHVSLEVCVSLAFSSHYVVGGRSIPHALSSIFPSRTPPWRRYSLRLPYWRQPVHSLRLLCLRPPCRSRGLLAVPKVVVLVSHACIVLSFYSPCVPPQNEPWIIDISRHGGR